MLAGLKQIKEINMREAVKKKWSLALGGGEGLSHCAMPVGGMVVGGMVEAGCRSAVLLELI